jgi:ribose 5-phosphate isomerase B
MNEKGKYLALGSDHAGFQLKESVHKFLIASGYSVKDYGCYSVDSVDYPDVIHPLAADVDSGKFERAIIICGSGIGVSMVANKYSGVRAALCCDSERVQLCRLHNDANVLALGARYLTEKQAFEMIDVFLNTEFEGGRHKARVVKIAIPKE